jgi:hypothetical protein
MPRIKISTQSLETLIPLVAKIPFLPRKKKKAAKKQLVKFLMDYVEKYDTNY